jgi:hypothetical protein
MLFRRWSFVKLNMRLVAAISDRDILYGPGVWSHRQDEVWASRFLIMMLLPEKRHRFNAVPHNIQRHQDFIFLESLAGKADIPRIIFDQRYVKRPNMWLFRT